jgi:uncharacterized protein (TIRG00374 family)
VSKKLRLAASSALLAIVACRIDWSHVCDAFANLRVSLWLLATAVYAVTQVVSALRWRLLARPLGFREPFGRFLSYYYIGMFFNLVLPTSVGGDVVRAWYLDGKSGRKIAAFISVLADRVHGVVMLLLIALVALAFRPAELPAWMTWAVGAMTGGTLLGLGIVFILAWLSGAQDRVQNTPCAIPSTQYSVLGTRYSAPSGWGLSWRTHLRNLQLAIMPSSRVFFCATLLSLVIQLANVLIVYLIGLALGGPIDGSYYLILVPTVTLLTLLPISLNGMGVREGSMAVLLAPLGIEPSMAVTLAFLWFAVFVVPSLGGVVFYLFGRVPHFGKKGDSPLEEGGLSPFFPRFEVRSNDPSVGRDPHQGRAGQPHAAA